MSDSLQEEIRAWYVSKHACERIFEVLAERGYLVVGPTIDQQAIVIDRITSAADLPRGWTDTQAPGEYRLVPREDDAWFGYVVGPQSWKAYLYPPTVTLSRGEKTAAGWRFENPNGDPPRLALFGVRACDLAAMRVQDRVLLSGPYRDPVYEARRTQAVVIAVNCTQAASTCFCTSMGTGPECASGFDLALTELPDGFVVEAATAEGEEILAALDRAPATIEMRRAAQTARRQAVEQIERRLDTTDIRDLLIDNLEHPQWDNVASRCLSCTNCTMVCPTCFCTSISDVSDLATTQVERRRQWDSCFNIDFSYTSGGSVRDTIRSRYRQWLTHKLASWHDQFGTSGCVGCGRCITWCPVGIDLTEEVAAIRGKPS